jgi:hypothetical protein
MSERRMSPWAWVTIIVPYLALGFGAAALAGVADTRADTNALAAAEATEEAAEAKREADQSCNDVQAAVSYFDAVLRSIAAALPPRTADTITGQLDAHRPSIDC